MRLKWCKISMKAKDWCFLSQLKKCSIKLSIQRGQIHGVNFVTLLSYVSIQLNKVADTGLLFNQASRWLLILTIFKQTLIKELKHFIMRKMKNVSKSNPKSNNKKF